MRISKDWLEYTPPGSIFRVTAAEIAVKVAQWFVAFKENGGFASGDSGKDFCGPMLMAFREKQDEVTELSLKLAARKVPKKAKAKNRDGHPMFTRMSPRRGTIFPDGPLDRVDDDFEEACLDTENLIPMMKVNPALVKEILLAVLISEPENAQDPASHNFKYDIKEPHQWFPPFYSRGPFLKYFRTAPTEAISFVITLTNFAAEEWKLEQQARRDEITFIKFDIPGSGTRAYYGDNRVYYWFRDIGNAPHSLISILMALEKFLIELIDEGKEPDAYIKEILENSSSLALIGLLSSVGRYSRKLFLTVLKPFLECFDLYQFESGLDYGAMNLEGHQNIGTNFLASTTQELAWKWNAMPHRKISIKSVALPLMLSDQHIYDLFKNKIVPAWAKLNQERTDEGFIDPFLVNTIAQFSPENYVPYQDEQNVGLIYQEPEEITQRLEAVRSATNFDSDDFTFAFARQQELERNREYEITELDKIWEKLQAFYQQPEGSLFEHLNKRLSNIFASIAILVSNKPKLKVLHPEYYEWISNVAGEVLEKVTFDLRESTMLIGPGSWEGFAAIFVPQLFAEEPENKRYRRWMGILTLNINNETVGKLFKETSKYFKFSDPVFIQLQNLYIERCRLVHREIPTHWNDKADWKKVFTKILAAYTNNQTEKKLIKVGKLISAPESAAEPDEVHRIRRRGRQVKPLKDPGIDLDLLFPSIQFPDWGTITDANDQAYILHWYQMMTDVRIQTWGKITEDAIPLDISLSSFDHWLILKLSQLLPRLEKDEANKLWEPLLAYGNLSSKWLISFLDNLIVHNYQIPENYEALGRIWNEMIDFAHGAPTWKYKGGFFHDHWELWQGVLGISNLQMEVWKLGYQELLLKFSKKTIAYITKTYMNPEAINKLATLMKSPGALNFIDPGVLLIAAHLKFQDALDQKEVPAGKVRMPFKYDDSVAGTCSYLWTNCKQDILKNDSIFQSFKQIIIHLVAIQNPIGLELQDRLIE